VTPPTVAFFCMAEPGHFRRLLPLISAMPGHGMDAVVFTDLDFAPEVRAAGARFVDLFAGRPLSAADDTSRPFPSRFVTFAGRFGDGVVAQARALAPQVVVADSFAVIGRVVAAALEVPYVNVCAGHNVHPALSRSMLSEIPGVRTSDACHNAVEVLRERFGLEGVSPFSYVAPPSPFLNLYCEPPQYLTEHERQAFEPVQFFGSLPARSDGEEPVAPAVFPARAQRKVYVSFGTVVWRYFMKEAIAALTSITAAIARSPGTHALVSLGRARFTADVVAALEGPNVRVESYVDQWQVLAQTDCFITHHGLNSTHEAVFHDVPMLSQPFFWDQPAMARKAQAFGFALPLASEPRATPEVGAVQGALERVFDDRGQIAAALSRARDWEREVLAQRPAVMRAIAQLA
jgi:UDP:flavonoid glycosyltransferase YjiC (YdhE family)